jgi:hypothetical protein
LEYGDLYGDYIQSYDAEIYIKGTSQVKKKNFLLRYAPDFLYLKGAGNNNLTESFVDVHFESPNFFIQQIKAVNGSHLNINDIQNRVMPFLNINIYNPSLFNNQILSPEIKDAHKYYRFEYVSCTDTLNLRIHKIEIIPLIKSPKLLSGYINIVDEVWTIFSMDITGRSDFYTFRVETEFGLQNNDFLLPQKTTITFQIKLLGNEVINRYFSSYHYSSLSKRETKEKVTNYDLSDYFKIQIDSISVIKDSIFWEKNRPIELTSYEKEIYAGKTNEKKSQDQKEPNALALFANKSWRFSQGIITPRRFIFDNTRLNYSGLLNPLKIDYSKTNGISYWQQFRLNKQFSDKQEIQFSPRVGLLFQRKEAFFNTPTRWVFQPSKFGEIYFNFENRNQAFSSKIINEINEKLKNNQDTINFNDFNLEYYKHYHLALHSRYEALNGLLLRIGLDYDWYNPIKSKDSLMIQPPPDDTFDIISDKYRTFSPTLGIVWTPGQYYRIKNRKKEYVGSRYPTFSIDYCRGIKSFLNSNSDYERIEIDVQQNIPVGMMNSFQYYVGAGCFTNTQSVYFADFKNFARNNFPVSWGDPIGGVFHLLSGEWYNASNFYIQAHCMYESPFALSKLFRKLTRDIFDERFFFSQLYTPALRNYTELGYGIGNFLGNAGVFVSFKNGEYESVGFKFTFELGK